MTDKAMTELVEQIEEQMAEQQPLPSDKNFFLQEFDDETMEAFIDWADTPATDKVIYLNTGGGHLHVCNAIVNKINENPKNYHIKMHGNVISAGVFLIMYAQCTVEDIADSMDDYTIYLYHNAYIEYNKTPKKHTKEHYKRMLGERNTKAYLKVKDHLTMEQNQQLQKYFKYQYHPVMKHFVNDDIYLDLWQIKRIVGDRYVPKR